MPGLSFDGTPKGWSIGNCAAPFAEDASHADILIGHDLGGVVAALLAQPGQSVVLSGTALGLYWTAIRLTALPQVHRFFYEKHQGRHFIARGSMPEHARSLLEAFGDRGPNWGARMRRIAQGMKPPAGLGRSLRSCGVRLVWGRRDPWYPQRVALAVQRSTGGHMSWLDCGHFVPWEDPRGFTAVLTGTALVDSGGAKATAEGTPST